jgi:hypothetical protein
MIIITLNQKLILLTNYKKIEFNIICIIKIINFLKNGYNCLL